LPYLGDCLNDRAGHYDSSILADIADLKTRFKGSIIITIKNKLCGRPPQYAPAPCDLDLWPFDVESGVRLTCDVRYPCASFSLPRPLCSRLRPDVRDRRQTDVKRASSLNVPYPSGGA